jgi:hypothetical protein
MTFRKIDLDPEGEGREEAVEIKPVNMWFERTIPRNDVGPDFQLVSRERLNLSRRSVFSTGAATQTAVACSGCQ